MPSFPDDTIEDPLRPPIPERLPMLPQLVVALECDRPLAGAARYVLDGAGEVVIGRGQARSVARDVVDRVRRVTITVPDACMSTNHARLVPRGSAWGFEDTGSRNGSLVNGAPVTRALVSDGDVIQLGHTLFVVRTAMPMAPGTPDDIASDSGVAPLGLCSIVPTLARSLESLATVAASTVPVLLVGETGTGKEVLARAVHEHSAAVGAFVGVNCGALPDALVESLMFGHVKGAFSGAVRDEIGFVRSAHGGTLFLDEVTDLAQTAQVKLLRVLQEKEIVPVGATRPIPVNVRVVAATQPVLEARTKSGAFRRDLLGRLAGYIFPLPNLWERREDIGVLVAALLTRVAPERAATLRLHPDVGRALITYAWPGNIRELEHCLRLGVVLAKEGTIELAHLPASVAQAAFVRALPAEEPTNTADEELRNKLVGELTRQGGNVSNVARELGIARPQVHRLLKRFRINSNDFRR